VSTDSVSNGADKRDLDQITAGWAGLVVCGLVAAILWFFGISAIMDGNGVETSALDCAAPYGVTEPSDCPQS